MVTANARMTVVAELTQEIYAEVVEPGSPSYLEARALQAQRFARASEPRERADYLSTVDFAPQHTVPIVIRRHRAVSPEGAHRFLWFRTRAHSTTAVDPLIGTVRLELPAAMIIREVVRFLPDSQTDRLLHANAVAEIGGFATSLDLAPNEALDVIDAAVAALVQAAQDEHIERLWVFPRRTLMGLLLANIPDLLPPYSFTLCRDVAGWNEGSPRLQEVRDLRVKGLRALPDEYPIVYECDTAILADDLERRREQLRARQRQPDLGRQLLRAMRDAQKRVNTTIQTAHAELLARAAGDDSASADQASTPREPVPGAELDGRLPRSSAPAAPADAVATKAGLNGHVATDGKAGLNGHVATDGSGAPRAQRPSFLPFATETGAQATYLRAMGEQADVRTYKALSYELLEVQPGMQVLDVGCGAGADLPALADLVGPKGVVFGLERDPELVETAREAMAQAVRTNVILWTGNAETTTFPEATFDRARADRVLQHVDHPDRVVDEMRRLLRPNGIMTLVEPDWRAIALYPASPTGGDDDTTLSAILAYYQRHLAHALVGRQLHALLHQAGSAGWWAEVRVQTIAFTLTSWPVVDAVLQLTPSARALEAEVPALATQIDDWLAAVADADRHGQFYATIPLFFAAARKAAG